MPKEFKGQALRLPDEIGVKKAASQLGTPYYMLADERNNRKTPPIKVAEMTEEEIRSRNNELERENAKLRVANEILKDALVFL